MSAMLTRCIITLPVIVRVCLMKHGMTRWVRDYFAVIATRGYMVETNTKSYHELGTFYPEERYFPFLKELGIRVQVNSDAHYPERINNARFEGLAALKKAGFTSVVEWHGGKWEDIPIG